MRLLYRYFCLGSTFLAASFMSLGVGLSASLSVRPTGIDVLAPGNVSTVTAKTTSAHPVNAQIRVFRWVQEGGTERLEETTDVVASPPAAQIIPNTDYVVRVVRVNKTPVQTEEAYRLVIDELPDPARLQAGAVNVMVRQMLPVFFHNPDAGIAKVNWSISHSGNNLVVTAQNQGGSRAKITDLSIEQGGRKVATRPGLVGYVLAGSTMQWKLDGKKLSGGSVKLLATTEKGPITATVNITGK